MLDSEVYVALATLYLRLSGYFTTGLILHSPDSGKNKTEIDCLAIRHPWHDQAARMVESPAFLCIRNDEIDLVLCEVKSSRPGFNSAIQDEDNLADALRWAGVFRGAQVTSVARRLAPLLKEGADSANVRDGIVEGNVRVRPLLCCPPLPSDGLPLWCLTGHEIFRFVHLCLDVSSAPATCARKYAYELWGTPYSEIVRWFKETKNPEERTLRGLCDHMIKASRT